MTWAWPRSTCTYCEGSFVPSQIVENDQGDWGRGYYEGVAKHVVRRDTKTMAEQRKLKRSYDVSFKLRAVDTALITSLCL